MRASPLVLVLLAATAAAAQPADRLGVYASVGASAPERSLFPDAVDPVLVVGARPAAGVDVHLGVRLDTRERILAHDRVRPAPGDVADQRLAERTRAVAGGVGLGRAAGPFALRLHASLGLDVYARAVTTPRAPSGPDAPAVSPAEAPSGAEGASATFAHGGLAAVAAVPLGRGRGRVAPGLGVAVAASRALRGDLGAPPARLMPFLSLPATVRLPAADVTLDTRLGVARGAGSRAVGRTWAPVVESSVRVDL